MARNDDPLGDARMLYRGGGRGRAALWSDTSREGMIATAHYRATAAGRAMFEQGGNAVDAAVAAALALGVCEPAGSGLGGMAIATLHEAASGRTVVVEGACRAPRNATPEAVGGARRYSGYRAVAVPTNAAVLAHLCARYGTLSPARVAQPAIETARAGCPITPLQSRLAGHYAAKLGRSALGKLFLTPSGAPLPAGTLVRRPALAATLEHLAEAGFEDFYRGTVGKRIAADFAAHRGFLDSSDLEAVGELREAEPLKTTWNGNILFTAGPPAGGLALVEMVALAAAMPGATDPACPSGAVRAASIIRRARQDRRRTRLEVGMLELRGAARLLEPAYVRATAWSLARELGSGETSHISAMDADGNAIALTQSIERSFGAGVATPELGFFYNGYLRAFKVKNARHPHFLQPGAVARSNAAPTLLLHGGVPTAAVGSTGSERMASGIFQVLLRLAAGTAPFEAVHAPRLHCTPEGEVFYETRLPEPHLSALAAAGLHPSPLEPYAFQVGGLQLVARRGTDLIGVAEPRRDGAAAGPRAAGSAAS